MRLILTRHGKTIENEKGILQGQMQGTLSKSGKIEAKKLALRLKKEKIDCIYSSDLTRAVDTAKEIARFHPNTQLLLAKELRDTDIKHYSGKRKEELDWNNRPTEIESRESMKKRGKLLIDKAYKKYSDKTVLFVGHNGINRAIITLLLNKPVEYSDKLESPKNASISIFEITEDKKNIIHLLNCVKHLK